MHFITYFFSSIVIIEAMNILIGGITMTLNESFFSIQQVAPLWHSTLGIERETLRVQPDGTISSYPHRKDWGTRNHQPYIQTDFAESQVEIITPPEYTADHLMSWLKAAHQIVSEDIVEEQDLLWPFSMPACIPTDTTKIKIAQLTNQKEYAYREGLARLYGKHVQLISGIHYNFQLNPDVIEANYQQHGGQEPFIDYHNETYMHLVRNYFRYRWFLTYFLGASPYVAENYSTNFYGKPHQIPMRSIRQSRYGYQNKETVVMDYTDLYSFVQTIEAALQRGDLHLEKELYRDVRLRGASPTRDLLKKGISYLEFRNIDINPYLPYGIDKETINFIRHFLISILFLEDDRQDNQVVEGHQMNYRIAEAHPLDACPFKEEALHIIQVMDRVNQELSLPYWPSKREYLIQALDQPELTLAGQIVTETPDSTDYLEMGLTLAQQHQQTMLEQPFLLHGFEDFELSTQDVLKEAIRRGIRVDIIDKQDNFLQLSYKDQQELVRNANMTRLDSLITYFSMENKVATKFILSQNNIRVPNGKNFNTFEAANAYYSLLPNTGLVIKPKNTNYGLGISIFVDKPNEKEYQESILLALAEDDTVIIEEYVKGTELRFYLQNHEVLGIVERQPAQVIGDGTSSIQQLIEKENQNPLRGVKHMAPMTTLELGSVEILQLKHQGLTVDSVPEAGQIVHLRENSNVSTGGISIDRTHDVHPSYIHLAQNAARALDAHFCGVDMIIEDYSVPADNHNYAIIEANYNPNITIHRHPGEGEPRLLGKAVLEELFPEAFS